MSRLKRKIRQMTIIKLFLFAVGLIIKFGKFEIALFRRVVWLVLRPLAAIISLGRKVHGVFYAFARLFIKKPVDKTFLIFSVSAKKSGQRLDSFSQRLKFGLKGLMRGTKNSFASFFMDIRSLPSEAKRRFSAVRPKRDPFYLKQALGFAVLVALLVAPLKLYDNFRFLDDIKTRIVGAAESAWDDILNAKDAIDKQDLTGASASFSRASDDFFAAQNELDSINSSLFVLADLIPSEKTKLVAASNKLTESAQAGTRLAAQLITATDGLFAVGDKPFTDNLQTFIKYGSQALVTAEVLNQKIGQVDSQAIPESYRGSFATIRKQTAFLENSLRELLDLSDKLQIFLGQNYDKRYLLIFQNNTEARATGGFIGSFAIVDFKQGKIKKLQTPEGGTYDTEGGLTRTVLAPGPLQLLRAKWHMWDANWWPHFPDSAKQLMWFYEHSGGSTVDGVISLTPDVVIDLLEIIGPIDMTEEYGAIIGPENFLDVVQSITEDKENDDNQANKPKRVIGELLDKVLSNLFTDMNKDSYLQLIKLMERNLNQKNILLYFDEDKLQQKVKELGWDGRLKQSKYDYLSVVNTNIGGGKSDKDIEQTIKLQSDILTDGSVINTLTIWRDHTGSKGQGFSGVRNVNWMRVYVPLGSTLMEADGFGGPDAEYFDTPDPAVEYEMLPALEAERNARIHKPSFTHIYREQNKTVFANWDMIEPETADMVRLVYKLPFKLAPVVRPPENFTDKVKLWFEENPENLYHYTLLVQKQAGANNSQFAYELNLPVYYEEMWQSQAAPYGQYTGQETDLVWGYLFKQR